MSQEDPPAHSDPYGAQPQPWGPAGDSPPGSPWSAPAYPPPPEGPLYEFAEPAGAYPPPVPQPPMPQPPMNQPPMNQPPMPGPPGPYGTSPGYGQPPYPPQWGWSGQADGPFGAGPAARRPAAAWLAGVVVGALLLGGAAGGAAGYLAGRQNISLGGSIELDDTASPAVNRPPDSVAGIAARVLPGVVKIEVRGGGALGTGTGFVIDKAGYIVTNSHVVGSAGKSNKIRVQFPDKQTATATLVGQDPSSDLAVVRVRNVKGLQPLAFGNSEAVAVGDPVIAVGTPLGLAGSVTTGIVSAKNRAVTAGGPGEEPTYINALQTDAAINPGNSGGPLVNSRGEVIGVTSAIASITGAAALFGGQSGNIGVGFAIPANLAQRAIEQLIETGKAVHPVIGATLDPSFAGEGAKIVSSTVQGTAPIVKDGPADRAGIQPGDLVISIDGQKVSSADELIVAIRTHKPGETVELVVRRGSKEHTYKVVLGKSS